MRKTFFVTFAAAAIAATASAQTPATLRLSVDEAVKMALEDNVDLNADRLDPQISDTRVAAAAGVFKPTLNTAVNSNNQLVPPSNFLIPTPTRTDVVTSTAGVSQRLPWYGTTYSLSWSATHTNSNSFLNSYNPLLQSGLGANVSQPLPRHLKLDFASQPPAESKTNRDTADTPRQLERRDRGDRFAADRHPDARRRSGDHARARRSRRPPARAQGHRQREDRRRVYGQPEAARRPPQRELSGERIGWHAGAAQSVEWISRHDRRPGADHR